MFLFPPACLGKFSKSYRSYNPEKLKYTINIANGRCTFPISITHTYRREQKAKLFVSSSPPLMCFQFGCVGKQMNKISLPK